VIQSEQKELFGAKEKMPKQDMEKSPYILLYENSSRGVSFHLFIATLLALLFWHFETPLQQCVVWLLIIISLNAIRMFLLEDFYHKNRYQTHPFLTVVVFTVLSIILGVVWGLGYLIFLPHLGAMREALVILTLGGMAICIFR
jgi:hypothetical protein